MIVLAEEDRYDKPEKEIAVSFAPSGNRKFHPKRNKNQNSKNSLTLSYNCQKEGNHIAANCPEPKRERTNGKKMWCSVCRMSNHTNAMYIKLHPRAIKVMVNPKKKFTSW